MRPFLEIAVCFLAGAIHFRLTSSALLRTVLTIWTSLSLSMDIAEATYLFHWMPMSAWFRALGWFWFGLSIPLLLSTALWRQSRRMDRDRRLLLRAGASLAAAPAAAFSFAIHKARREPELRQVEFAINGLHPDLDGLRLVQLSDIHLSAFYSRDQLRRAVDQANTLQPHIALVTGDLITSPGDPIEDAVMELARLRASAGVFGCLGNHEIVAGVEDATERLGLRRGIRFLRSSSTRLGFGDARLNLAGVDYQRTGLPYLEGAQALQSAGMPNLLLSHNPDVFPVAASQSWDLTLAGHTHGGQITLEHLHPSLNPARFQTPFVRGAYSIRGKQLFVSCGLGTVGLPARFGTVPEIALIKLVRAPRP